ncbi:MAG: hypothetical protein R3C61_24315 [Bacteroidia bacterium]
METESHEKNGRFEAPNWMPDGKKLLFNMDGSLYKILSKAGEIEKSLTPGDIARNNTTAYPRKTIGDQQPSRWITWWCSTRICPSSKAVRLRWLPKIPSYFHG